MDYVIGCDVGSQSTKAVLLGLDGRLAGEASQGYAVDYPHPLWAEQPVKFWTTALTASVRRLLAETGVPATAVRALAMASQVDGVVPIDAAGSPLRSCLIWMDRRAAAECQRARATAGEARIFDLTGLNLDPSHVAPKVQWISNQEPAIFERTARCLTPSSYMAYYLTGEVAIDHSVASCTLLLDIRRREWSPEMCALFGISLDQLPPIRPATAPLGRLRPTVAEALGLRPETLVMVGCGDEHAACLGAGVVEAGLIGDIAGTAEPVCAAAQAPAFDPTHLVETHCHAEPSLWLLENPGFVSGANFRWWRDHFSPQEVLAADEARTAYAQLDALAEPISPGAQGLVFLPCLMGAMAPTWNEDARGTFFGFTLAHTRAHFIRALLEGSAYAVRDITDQMQAIGLEARELRVVGGGAKSPLWCQIKADVTGLPVVVPQTTETTALGAGFLALVGLGAYATTAEAAARAVQIRQRFEPQPSQRAAYDEAYALYRTVYFSLAPAFQQAARLTAG
jgi:xylulokinase